MASLTSSSDSSHAKCVPPSPIAFVDLATQRELLCDRLDRAIARVLENGQYIMGAEVQYLEADLAAYSKARHAVSCASGSDALLIAMMALGVESGDAVLCPAFTYTATPESIALLGAAPIFVDVDEASFNICPSGLSAGLRTARAQNLRPVGIIAVDLFGLPADYAMINNFAQENDLFVLSDAAQSFGATRDGRRVGTFGVITTTSFFPAKPLGCYGDGGALFTEDDELAKRIASIRLHGKASGNDKYAIERVGINSRLDTLQAAILIEKLRIFDEELNQRQKVAERYTDALGEIAVTPRVPDNCRSVWAQYTIRVTNGQRERLAERLRACGVPTAVYYPRPLHQQPAYESFPTANSGVPVSERLCSEVLSLPMHPYLLPEQQDYIVEWVKRVIG